MCAAITCPSLDPISDGMISYDQGRAPGPYPYSTTVTYTCNEGFDLQGDVTRQCSGTSVTGIWSGSAPVCIGRDKIYA